MMNVVEEICKIRSFVEILVSEYVKM